MNDLKGSLAGIAGYVKVFFNEHQDDKLLYHNFAHTCAVVKHADTISKHYSLSETGYFSLMAAAWFHDTGQLVHAAEGHEKSSIILMQDYFSATGIEVSLAAAVELCIACTQLPNDPQSLLAKILCDADLFHLGSDDFFICNELVKQEIELRNNVKLKRWDEDSLTFIRSHHYFTAYCRELLDPGKLKNITLLEQKIHAV